MSKNLSPEVRELRDRALMSLRTNPRGFDFITGEMSDGGNGRCSLGLIAEEFSIEIDDEGSAYDKIRKLLKIAPSYIWQVNDSSHPSYRGPEKVSSFFEVATGLEELDFWNQSELTDDQIIN